jgi:hypothetical protein
LVLVLAVRCVVDVATTSERVEAPLEEAPDAALDASAPPFSGPAVVIRPPQPSTRAAPASAPGPNRAVLAMHLIAPCHGRSMSNPSAAGAAANETVRRRDSTIRSGRRLALASSTKSSDQCF